MHHFYWSGCNMVNNLDGEPNNTEISDFGASTGLDLLDPLPAVDFVDVALAVVAGEGDGDKEQGRQRPGRKNKKIAQ